MSSATLAVPRGAADRCSTPGAGHPAMAAPRMVTTTVPRQYVHRTAISEVFLTDWWHTGDETWSVSAQWPRAHSFYGPAHGLHDPVLLVETIRQAGILLDHVAYDVPLDHPIIWKDLHYQLRPEALRESATPAEVELQVSGHDIVRRWGRLLCMRQTYRITCNGLELATAVVNFTCHSQAVYRRLRGEYADLALANERRVPPPEPVTPQLVGRDRPCDVVLAPAEGTNRWQLRVDTSHPVLFDHPVDHVPGMLLVEAARQAAHAVAGPGFSLPVGLRCAFARYGELDSPCWIQAVPKGRDAQGRLLVEVTAEQNGRIAFLAELTCQPLS